MSKKQKRRPAASRPKHAVLGPDELARKAREDLESGRSRDAIAGFKELLKQDPRPEWRDGLAEAYAARAGELASKGMLKEAKVMWENRSLLEPDIPITPGYASVLIGLGQLEPLLAQLAEPSALDAATHRSISALVAARVASGSPLPIEQLPEDSLVRRHAGAARAALTAYSSGDAESLRASLSAIPFRSPYRDLAQILRALQLLTEDPAEAGKLLERISPDSAFASLKGAVELALQPEPELIRHALDGRASWSRIRMASQLRGWPEARLGLLEELRRLGPNPAMDSRLRLLHRYRVSLGEDWARRSGLKMLTSHLPKGLDWHRASGAKRPTEEEMLLVLGRKADQSRDVWASIDCWTEAADAWEIRYRRFGGTADDRLRIALMLRRPDQANDLLGDDLDTSATTSELYAVTAQMLETSLEWDPEHRETYLRLIRFYRAMGRPKDARRLLDAATGRWPEDMRILETTMEIAIDSGAFKKASALARRLLAIDPINTGVRDLLVDAHLSHARKQLVKERPDLARRELAAAAEWVRTALAREQLDILTALVSLEEDAAAGAEALQAIADRLGGGLTAKVALTLAGDPGRRDPTAQLKSLGRGKTPAANRQDLLEALVRLRHYLDKGQGLSARQQRSLSTLLGPAPWGALERGELEAACETLRRAKLHEVRAKAARAALKRWRGAPIFKLHAFEAKHPGGYYNRFSKEALDLDLAMEQARADGDTRTALRIQAVLDDMAPPFMEGLPPPMPMPMPPMGLLPDEKEAAAQVARGFIEMMEELGIDKAMELINMPRDLRRSMSQTARELGQEAVIADLVAFFDLDASVLGPPPDSPRPRPSKPGRDKAPKTKKSDDDDPPVQLDLFS